MMMMTSMVFMTMIGAGAANGANALATPAPVVQLPGGEGELMPIDTCVRACLACDKTGNPVSCAVCALCSEPAVAGSSK